LPSNYILLDEIAKFTLIQPVRICWSYLKYIKLQSTFKIVKNILNLNYFVLLTSSRAVEHKKLHDDVSNTKNSSSPREKIAQQSSAE